MLALGQTAWRDGVLKGYLRMLSRDRAAASSPETPASVEAPRLALGGRFPWRTAILVAGDALSFLVFAASGRQQHGEASGFAALAQIAQTAWPFALGWFVVAPWLGAYRERLTTGVLNMLKRTELAWVCAWPVVLLSRWALGPDHQMPLSFALVILVSNAIFLGVWRSVFAWIAGRLR